MIITSIKQEAKKLALTIVYSFVVIALHCQTYRVEETAKNFSKQEWFKMNGGVTLNSMYMQGNVPPSSTLSYLLAGNVHFQLFNTIQVPLSISLTNTGANVAYPTLPNRFSLHPSYKWATLHLGDITLPFSPYTLSDHQFTGVGLELSPDKWKIAAMYGQLQRKLEYDTANVLVPAAYQRMGVGTQVRYQHETFTIGSSIFLAKDNETSLLNQPDSVGIFPQQNLASQVDISANVAPNIRLMGEYAFSLLDRDMRIPSNGSRVYYQSYNMGIAYTFLKNELQLKYERIDPQYSTLGTYYSNSDYENITVNFTTQLLKDKVQLATNVGVQNDDLDGTKGSRTSRFVGAVNVAYTPSQRVSINAGYSNFQSHKNVKSQFNYINQYDIVQNLDTLDFVQLSQNANFMCSYVLQQTDSQNQNVQFTTNWQQAKDTYIGISNPSNFMSMLNSYLMHTIQFNKTNWQVSSSFNYTYSDMQQASNTMFGPTVAVSARFLNKTLQSGVSYSCNWSYTEAEYDQFVTNIRIHSSYTFLKKHTLQASGTYQLLAKNTTPNIYRTNLTIAYRYTF